MIRWFHGEVYLYVVDRKKYMVKEYKRGKYNEGIVPERCRIILKGYWFET